ncbi:MAG TPA: response regulator [Aggregicoccus sp.]|nr:response regulator [Aggregicoccus sp.]
MPEKPLLPDVRRPATASHPVLVIDDDPDIREALSEVLTEEGFRVHDAVDGVHALERLARLPRPCVLLLDWRMPRLDGKGVLDALETQGALSGLTVLVQTATPADVDDVRVTRVLPKPLDLGDILEALEGHARPKLLS